MLKFSARGFTFVELLVVISILGILSAISISAYGNSLKNSRDAKRQTDLRLIQSALEKYHTDIGYYPCLMIVLPAGGGMGGLPPIPFGYDCTNGLRLSDSTQLTSETGRPVPPSGTPVKYYLDSIPKDPSGNYGYSPSGPAPFCDNTSDAEKCTKYCLYANLENLSGSIMNGCTSFSGFNFAVTSPD